MLNKSSSSGSANRIVATLCFWLVPFVGGTIYVAADMFTRPEVGHGFEYGVGGFQLGTLMLAILTSLNTIAFLGVFLTFPRIAARSALRLYLISAAAGIASAFAFSTLGWISEQIFSTSTALWIAFFVLGTIILILSAIISFFLLYGALLLGFVHRFRPATECQNCGYDLRASSGTCPECGMAYVSRSRSQPVQMKPTVDVDDFTR